MENSPTIFIVPTGIGCEVGGFAGDALPTAKLLASASGCLITCLLYTSDAADDP